MITPLLVVTGLFLFLPFSIYSGNTAEFSISFASVLVYLSPLAFALWVTLALITWITAGRFHQVFVSLTFSLGFLVWMQGNFLLWKYGVFDGKGINFDSESWRGWIDGSIWGAVLLLSVVFAQKVARLCVSATVTLICLQFAVLLFSSIQNPDLWAFEKLFAGNNSPPDAVFEYSEEKNVIHIVLDTIQSNYFEEILNEDEFLAESLAGFTFFRESISSYGYTKASIPSILTGETYENDTPMGAYFREVLEQKGIPGLLAENGFETDIIHSSSGYPPGGADNFYLIPVPYGVSAHRQYMANSLYLLDLAFFRAAPHALKKHIYNNQQWMSKGLATDEKSQYTYFSHDRFTKDLIARAKINGAQPRYKFVHLQSSHPPFLVTADCEYADGVLPLNKENTKAQFRCVLLKVAELLEELKTIGIFDSSLVILQADHGAHQIFEMSNSGVGEDSDHLSNKYLTMRLAARATALLAIKPFFSRDRFKISDAQVSNLDTAATVTSMLGIEGGYAGRNVFEVGEDEIRTRRYLNYDQDDIQKAGYFGRLDEFEVIGSVYDRASWHRGTTYHSPLSSYVTERIDFGTRKGQHFLRSGWGGNHSNKKDQDHNWMLGHSAEVFVSLSRLGSVKMRAHLRSLSFEAPQSLDIYLDDKWIGEWQFGKPWDLEWREITIHPDTKRPDISILRFVSSNARQPEWTSSPLSVLFEAIEFETLGSEGHTQTIDLGTRDSLSFLTEGWAKNEGGAGTGPDYVWALGDSAKMTIQLPENRPFTLAARIKSPSFENGQIITVLIDGEIVGRWEVSVAASSWAKPWIWDEKVLDIGPRPASAEQSLLEFQFSSHRNVPGKRPVAVLFDAVAIHEK